MTAAEFSARSPRAGSLRDLVKDEIRGVFQTYVMIPALKAAIGAWSGDAGWGAVRPPLVALDAAQTADLVAKLREKKFDMPGIKG